MEIIEIVKITLVILGGLIVFGVAIGLLAYFNAQPLASATGVALKMIDGEIIKQEVINYHIRHIYWTDKQGNSFLTIVDVYEEEPTTVKVGSR